MLKGDIVTIITKRGEGDEAITEIPKELTYVEVLSTTEEDGEDKDNKSNKVKNEDEKEKGKLATITLLVNSMQAELLASFENQRGIHVALKCRNNETLKKELLDEQDRIFKEMEEENEPGSDEAASKENEEGNGNKESSKKDMKDAEKKNKKETSKK